MANSEPKPQRCGPWTYRNNANDNAAHGVVTISDWRRAHPTPSREVEPISGARLTAEALFQGLGDKGLRRVRSWAKRQATFRAKSNDETTRDDGKRFSALAQIVKSELAYRALKKACRKGRK